MPPDLNPLGLLLTRPDAGIALALPGALTVWLAPVAAGFFPALFWTALVMIATRSGPPRRAYLVLLVYAVTATLLNAWALGRSSIAVSNLIACMTALFAGSAVAAWLVAPLLRYHVSSFQPLTPVGGSVLIGVPLALAVALAARSYSLVSIMLLGSVALGLLAALQLINAGWLTRFGLSLPALAILSTLLAIVESSLIAMLPIAVRMLYPSV